MINITKSTSAIALVLSCMLTVSAYAASSTKPQESVRYVYADVLSAAPVYQKVRISEPHTECYEQPVTQTQSSGGDPTGGAILGALIGGALGNQVGKGDGKKAATVAGAVVGGTVGYKVDKNNNSAAGSTTTTTQQNCRTVETVHEENQLMGYDVQYRYRGDVYQTHLNYEPADKLRIRVVVEPAE